MKDLTHHLHRMIKEEGITPKNADFIGIAASVIMPETGLIDVLYSKGNEDLLTVIRAMLQRAVWASRQLPVNINIESFPGTVQFLRSAYRNRMERNARLN